MDGAVLQRIKTILRESAVPFFEDSEIEAYYNENGNDFNATVYNLLLVKAEDTTLNVSGLTTADTSRYFLRLASKYRKRNSGILGGG